MLANLEAVRGWIARPTNWSLSRKFAMAGGLIMLVAMSVAGLFTSALVSRTTIWHTATATALLMDSFLSPLLQELALHDRLTPETIAALDRRLGGGAFRDRFPHVEIWKADGLVVYSTTPSLIGRRFPPPPGLAIAQRDGMSAQYTDLKAGEHRARRFSNPYLEVYVPIRARISDSIIAVAEIHEITAPLEQRLWEVRLQSWLAVASAALLLLLCLYGVVYRGSKTIAAQQAELRDRLLEIEDVSAQNRALRDRAHRASGRVAELTENYLRRLGADLHDGPAQLVGFAALKVEHVRRAREEVKREHELVALDDALTDALRDIRTISRGLMLPDIEHLPLAEVVDKVVHAHEQRTGIAVTVDREDIRDPVSRAAKICVYRFLQEGLNNAFRHASHEGQSIFCHLRNSVLTVAVQDCGGGGLPGQRMAPDSGLGQIGLRDRVESLGGTFQVHRHPAAGTRIEMSLGMTAWKADGGSNEGSRSR